MSSYPDWATWSGWLQFAEGWVSNGLALAYASLCIALLVCLVHEPSCRWLRARLPPRWIPTSREDPMYAAWVDLVLSAGGLAVIAWLMDAPVAALGMLAVTLFGHALLKATFSK